MSDQRLPDLIDKLYDAALVPDSLPHVLDEVAYRFGGRGMTVLDISAPMPLLAITPALQEHLQDYLSHWHERDVFVEWGRKRGIGPGVYVDHDHFDAGFRARNDFYQDFLRPLGTDGMFSAMTGSATGRRMIFSVQRRIGTGAASAPVRRQFGLVARHLSRATTIAERLGAATSVAAALASRLDRFDCAVAAVDRSGRVVLSNQRFGDLQSHGVRIQGGRIVLGWPAQQRSYEQMLADAFARPPRAPRPAMLTVRPTSGLLPLLVRVVPVSPMSMEQAFGSVPGAAALVMALDPTHPSYPVATDALVALGLTPSQARVAVLVGSGLTPRAAAERLAVTEATVRTTIKHLYARLGLSRQSDLTVLVSRAIGFGTD